MGRKIKKAAVVMMVGMMMGAQLSDLSTFGMSVQAETEKKDPDKDFKEEGKNSDKDLEEDDKDPDKDFKEEEKNPDKDLEEDDKNPDKDSETDDKGDEDKEDKEPEEEQEKEPVIFYHVECNGSDGKNGYYINRPDGSITHLSKRGVTRYLFENGNGEIQEGILGKLNERYFLKQMNFTNGRNELEIWMEDEEGHMVENSESRKEFWLDDTKPEVQFEVSGGSDVWHKEAAEIQIEAFDGAKGSQIGEIICKTGERVIGKGNKETEKFLIEEESKSGEGIPITIIVTDLAGNQTTVKDKIFIDRTAPKASIQGIQDYMITSKPVKVNYLAEEENEFQMVQAYVLKEDVIGKKQETAVAGWKVGRSEESGKIRKESSQILTEDGRYKLRMDVTDLAGNEKHVERQIIIDKENPVIAHIEELEGKYLKYFQWNYMEEDWIRDFTSYTYVMKLDDAIYRPGDKIEKEGVHTLAVEAVDSAGNKSEIRVRFVIDHTPPVVRFENIKEGESYEKERKFYVRTEEPEDQIEYIKINGKKQKNEKQKAVYEYKVEEAKTYEVEVKAVDLAGNEQVSRIGFQVEPEKTLFQKIADPVRKYIFYGNKKTVKAENQLKGERNKRNSKSMLWGSFTMVCVMMGIVFWKREQLKRILKKEHPEKADNKDM